jgi:peptidoglycan/xylan/chitin deacetylase (PgdA/CDA1 family)
MGLLRLFLALTSRFQLNKNSLHEIVFPYLRRRAHRHFQILMYHRVNNEADDIFEGVPTKEFAAQMEGLNRYYTVLPLEELVERALVGDVPPNSVAVTFDDGYRDNYEHAFPILKQYGIPATIFLTTGVIGRPGILWHDVVFELFRRTAVTSVEIEGRHYPLLSRPDRQQSLFTALKILRRLSPQERNEHIARMAASLDVSIGSDYGPKMLTWEQVGEMTRAGVTFGAHTVSHPILSRMPLDKAIQEIETSKSTIEHKLGRKVRSFAYPNGSREDFTEALKGSLKEAGFRCAVTTMWGINGRSTDPFELRRMWLWDNDVTMTAFKLGWYKFAPL